MMMKQQRLFSLDVVRGITVAGMILVNNGYKDSFPMLQHASWNGLSVSDFVFPFFLFIMGVSLYLSMSRRGMRFSGSGIWKVVKRTVLLFAIGIAINWFDMAVWGDGLSIGELRFWAVLQRIALCYFLVAMFAMCGRPLLAPWLIAVLVVAYTGLLICGNGYSQESLSNVLYRVDAAIFGESHLYHRSAVDPEGLLSTMCALVNTLAGYYCGMLLTRSGGLPGKVISLFVSGAVMVVIGFLMNFFHPYNKHIWSPSFAFATSGACSLLLACVMKWIDMDGRRGVWSDVFMVFGSNALLLYISSELMAIIFGRTGVSSWLYSTLSTLIPMPEFASLCYALVYVALNFLMGYPLWRKRIFVKL